MGSGWQIKQNVNLSKGTIPSLFSVCLKMSKLNLGGKREGTDYSATALTIPPEVIRKRSVIQGLFVLMTSIYTISGLFGPCPKIISPVTARFAASTFLDHRTTLSPLSVLSFPPKLGGQRWNTARAEKYLNLSKMSPPNPVKPAETSWGCILCTGLFRFPNQQLRRRNLCSGSILGEELKHVTTPNCWQTN